MKYCFENNKLIIDNSKEVIFNHYIYKVVEYDDDIVIVLLGDPYKDKDLQSNNVYAVDKDGVILWQIQDPKEVFPDYNYPKLHMHVNVVGNELRVISAAGGIYHINPRNGTILGSSWTK